MHMQARNEESPVYGRTTLISVNGPDEVIDQAMSILWGRLRAPGAMMTSPADVKNFLSLKLAELEHEVFAVLFLDAQHRVIAFEEMFRGTATQTSVYPREIVKAALKHNATAVVLTHNHPSGACEPSRADEMLTRTLKSALELIDVRVLDHIIVGGPSPVSFAEKGLL